MNPSREDLIRRIAETEARIAAGAAGDIGAAVPPTSAAKVRLFRSLFRGRADVFPTRFVGKKAGKPGYASACANKFVRGVCDLPRIKCGQCPNQAFQAADFDKASWQDDVAALVETCRGAGIPVSVERSRSGTAPTPGLSSPSR